MDNPGRDDRMRTWITILLLGTTLSAAPFLSSAPVRGQELGDAVAGGADLPRQALARDGVAQLLSVGGRRRQKRGGRQGGAQEQNGDPGPHAVVSSRLVRELSLIRANRRPQ